MIPRTVRFSAKLEVFFPLDPFPSSLESRTDPAAAAVPGRLPAEKDGPRSPLLQKCPQRKKARCLREIFAQAAGPQKLF